MKGLLARLVEKLAKVPPHYAYAGPSARSSASGRP